jgi:FXSXX-COOH protein
VAVESTTGDGRSDWQSELVDLSGMSLEQLRARVDLDAGALAVNLRKLLDDPDEPTAGFNSAV